MVLMLNKRINYFELSIFFCVLLVLCCVFWFVIFDSFACSMLLFTWINGSFFGFSQKQIFPSPTTGAFAAQSYNWKNQQTVKEEDKSFTNFSFHTQQQQGPPGTSTTTTTTTFQPSTVSAQTVCLSSNSNYAIKASIFSLILVLTKMFEPVVM